MTAHVVRKDVNIGKNKDEEIVCYITSHSVDGNHRSWQSLGNKNQDDNDKNVLLVFLKLLLLLFSALNLIYSVSLNFRKAISYSYIY